MNIYHHYVILLLLLSTHAFAQPFDIKTDAVYLSGDTNKVLILAHGRGKHPTWKVVNPKHPDKNTIINKAVVNFIEG